MALKPNQWDTASMTSVIRIMMVLRHRIATGRIDTVFTIAALDIAAPVPIPKEPITNLWNAARPHIIAETSLVGTYAGRRPSPARSHIP